LSRRRFSHKQQKEVGMRIRELLESKGSSISAAARAIGYRDPTPLIKATRGALPLPEARRTPLARFLGVDPDELLPKK